MDTSKLLRQPHVIEQYYTKCGLTCHPCTVVRQCLTEWEHQTTIWCYWSHRVFQHSTRAWSRASLPGAWVTVYVHIAEQFNLFQETMDYLLGTCFPYKTVSRHSKDKPWITDGFRRLIRQRQRARMSGDMEQVRRLGNLVNRTAPKLRHRFCQSKIATLEESSTHDWWKHMKPFLGRSSGSRNEMPGLANKYTVWDLDS